LLWRRTLGDPLKRKRRFGEGLCSKSTQSGKKFAIASYSRVYSSLKF
jgi:hypothetical protein